jgi:hypothetical protein
MIHPATDNFLILNRMYFYSFQLSNFGLNGISLHRFPIEFKQK